MEWKPQGKEITIEFAGAIIVPALRAVSRSTLTLPCFAVEGGRTDISLIDDKPHRQDHRRSGRRILKSIIVATVLVTGGSAAFAQRSTEADRAQGIRQSALAFTGQTQNRGLVRDASPGARAAGDRIATGSIANRPPPDQRPGSVNNRERLDQNADREPLASGAGRMMR